MTAQEKPKVDPTFTIVMGVIVGVAVALEAQYAFFWLTGAWFPLFMVVAIGIGGFISGATQSARAQQDKPPIRDLWNTLVYLLWSTLFLAHYAPQAHFPVFK